MKCEEERKTDKWAANEMLLNKAREKKLLNK